MNILAFEAAGFSLSTALFVQDKTVALRKCHNIYDQDSFLLSQIKEMMDQASIKFKDLNLILTTRGPGSFTGTRMTLAAAIGLNLALNIPAAACSVFEWVYDSGCRNMLINEHNKVLIALPSKRQEFFFQVWQSNHCENIFMADPQHLNDIIDLNSINVCIGSATDDCKAFLPAFIKCISYTPLADDLCNFGIKVCQDKTWKNYPCDPIYGCEAHVTIA